MNTPRSLYIHLPFCTHKCLYCNFVSGIAPHPPLVEEYLESLCRELELLAAETPPQQPLHTLYLGGGTPSLLTAQQVSRLVETVTARYGLSPTCEITLEANPEDVGTELVRTWKSLGINRISLGMQSMDDRDLRRLDRRNTSLHNRQAVEKLHQAGIDNISGDIILGVPGMELEQALQPMLKTGLTHLSAYVLSIEEGSRLIHEVRGGTFIPLDEEASLQHHREALLLIESAGLRRYEISSFTLSAEYQSRHNRTYWEYGTWYAAGMGAWACLDSPLRRIQNHSGLREYLSAIRQGRLPREQTELLDQGTRLREYLMLGLRLTEGVRSDRFAARWGRTWESCLDTAGLAAIPHLVADQKGFRLDQRGLELADRIIPQIWELIRDP